MANGIGNTFLDKQRKANYKIADPGASGTIVVGTSGTCEIVSSTGETRTLSAPTRSDLEVSLVGKTIGGTVTVTIGSSGSYNEAGDTNFTITAAGQYITLKSFEIAAGTFAWRRTAGDGVGSSASTTAAEVTFTDANEYTAQTTVEGALDEIYGGLIGGSRGYIALPLNCWRETSTMNVANAAGNGGVLASDTTPILSAINGATDGCQRLSWASSNNDEIAQSVVLPDDLDPTANIVFKCRIASGGTTNAVGFTLASYFNEGDTAIADTTTTNQTATYAEKEASIAAADIGAGIGDGVAGTLTIGLTPVAHTTDTLNMTASWLVYQKKLINA